MLAIQPNAIIGMSQFPNRLINHNYYNGGTYQLGYKVSLEDLLAYANANSTSFTSSSTQGQDSSDFSILEKVSAGYLMNTIDFSRGIRLTLGLRAEYTHDNVHNLSFGDTGIAPNSYTSSYYTLLPSASSARARAASRAARTTRAFFATHRTSSTSALLTTRAASLPASTPPTTRPASTAINARTAHLVA